MSSIVAHVDVRLTDSLCQGLDSMARRHKCSRSEMLRRIVRNAVCDTNAMPGIECDESLDVKRGDPSIADLFREGFSATQISTLARIPYKAVMLAIGRMVDREVAEAERSSRARCKVA